MGCLITFSGIDCCGKSTQIDLLQTQLAKSGARPHCRWLRAGYTPLFSSLKSFLRAVVGRRCVPTGATPQRQAFMQDRRRRRLWLWLAIADLGFETAVYLRGVQWLGRSVICDRYLEDSEIDFRINFPQENVSSWKSWRLVKRLAAKPQAAFLLDLPIEESLRRAAEKQEPFGECEELRYVRAAMYDEIKQGGNWTVLDARRPVLDLHQDVLRGLQSCGRVPREVAAGERQ